MYRNTLILLLLFLGFSVCAQPSFEGYIKYSITVESFNNMTNDDLIEIYGVEQKIYYKDGNFRIETAGNQQSWEIYLTKNNRQYLKYKNKSDIQIFSGEDETRVLANVTERKNDRLFNGRNLSFLKVQYTDGSSSSYWYDPNIFIEPSYFQNLKFAYLNLYWEAAKSPYLIHERITKDAKITYKFEQIMETEVQMGKFQIQK